MRFSVLFMAGGLVLNGSLFGQRVLHNQDLEDKGKSAATAATKLSSGSVTDKELQNLSVLEKAQIDRVLNAAIVTMRREIEALSTWGSAVELVDAIQHNIDLVTFDSGDPNELKKRQAEVDSQSAQLKDTLAKLKMASKQKPPSLDPVINSLGDVQDVANFVDEAAKVGETKEASAALQKLIDGLKELNTLISTVQGIWTSRQLVSVDPRTLAPSVEETELAVLAVEAQYLKELTLLRARQQLDYAAVRRLHDQVKKEIADAGLPPTGQIRSGLADLAAQVNPANYDQVRDQMRARVHILYLAASTAAQNMIAADIEATRETLAWRRYQIRTTAVYNGTYETAIQAAASRLSTYYSAGLKPSQVAQLLHDLAAAVSLPKIAF